MSTSPTDLTQYQFELPPERIAQKPIEPRDAARLMVVRRASGAIEHRRFTELPAILEPTDCLVANNTRVMRARLLGQRMHPEGGRGGRVEFLLLDEKEPLVWEGAFHASAKAKPGVRFEIPAPDGTLYGEIVRGSSESPSGTVLARFDRDPRSASVGVVPLPPYIDRAAESSDLERYQTVYARRDAQGERSAAAPTAGLHFTPRVREALAARGAGWEELTLNVGLGTFRPVKASDIRSHVMHEERYEIPSDVAERLNARRAKGDRIVAVGTTAVRALESAFDGERLRAGPGVTSLFIYPGGPDRIRFVGALLTNFHLPHSTLLMLVSAFAGRELILRAYAEAVREKYRFFSYGDAMLIL